MINVALKFMWFKPSYIFGKRKFQKKMFKENDIFNIILIIYISIEFDTNILQLKVTLKTKNRTLKS